MGVPNQLVFLKGQIFFVGTGIHAVRCVARTSGGSRCKRLLDIGQTTQPVIVRTPTGSVWVHKAQGDPATVSRWRAQHCRLHRRAGVADATPPEWQAFDPRGFHADLLVVS